jgi:signal transduction histidine kinase
MDAPHDLDTIAKIHARTARLHGDDFFAQLVMALTEALGVDHAMIGELFGPGARQSRVLSVAWDHALAAPFVYDLADTPCDTVLADGDVILYRSGVAARFPKDVALARRGIEAYAGTPLRARDGAYLGLLVVMHGAAIPDGDGVASLLRLFAARAGDELERLRLEERQELALEAAASASFDWLPEQGSTIWSRNAAALMSLAAAPPPGLESFAGLLDVGSAQVWSVALAGLSSGRDDALALTVRTTRGRWLSLSARCKRHPDGGLARLSGVMSDVTEQKALEERLHRAQTLESLGRLAGSVAHDFNNLLSVVVGSIELARRRRHAPEETERLLCDALGALDRATELTRQLLTFGRPRPTTSETDVARAVRELEPILRRLCGAAVTITLEASGTLPSPIDRSQLEQVLVNLVVNARDAIPERGQISVSLSVREPTALEVQAEGLTPGAAYAHLRVADSGSGMDAATVAAAFSPFFTTKGDKGTGLGLATCQRVVSSARGTIWIESALGGGTTVHVLLPLARTGSLAL